MAVTAGVLATITGLAYADVSPDTIIRDCARDGKLDRQYSLRDLLRAEKKLPADGDEYTTCRDVINQAELAGRAKAHKSHTDLPAAAGSGGSGGNTNGGSPSPGPKDAQALSHATSGTGEAPSLSVNGETVSPDSVAGTS